MKLSGGRAFQIVRTGSAEALMWEQAWCVQGAARRPEWISIRVSQGVWFSASLI